MAFGEYWDTCEYTDGVLNYNQVSGTAEQQQQLQLDNLHRPHSVAAAQVAMVVKAGAATAQAVFQLSCRVQTQKTSFEVRLLANMLTYSPWLHALLLLLQDAHRQRTVNWVDATGGTNAAFDFTTKGILQEALGRNELWRLVDAQVCVA
jgi:hypothetical protein